MSPSEPSSEDRLAALLRLMPPAPEARSRAARDLPRARREMDQILALAEVDAQFREELLADLEQALARAGFQADRRMVDALQERLGAGPPPDSDR